MLHRLSSCHCLAVLTLAIALCLGISACGSKPEAPLGSAAPEVAMTPRLERVPAYVDDLPPVATPSAAEPSEDAPSHLSTFLGRNAGNRIPADLVDRLPAVEAEADRALVRALLLDRSDDETVRHEAANLLRRSQDPQLDHALTTVLLRPDETERFRSFAAQHLGINLQHSPEPQREQSLVRILRLALDQDPDREVRREAFQALLWHGDDGVTRLLEGGLSSPGLDGYRDLAIHHLVEHGTREAIPEIRERLRDPDPAVLVAAVNALGRLGDATSIDTIRALRPAQAGPLQRACDLALSRMGVLP